LVDPGFRLPAVASERSFRISLAAVALVYLMAFGSVLLFEPEGGGALPPESRGQVEGQPSIEVAIVDAPSLDARNKVSRAGADAPPQPNEMNLPLPPAPPVKPTELTPPQPPQEAPEPEEAEKQPEPEPAKEKPEKREPKKAEPALEGIDLQQRQASQPSTAFVGGSSSIKAAAKSGKTDAYSQSVIAALLKSKPAPFALRGSVMVSFEIMPDGSLKFVKMLHSSGNTAMDQVAVAAIRRARFDAPPPGYSPDDLTYIINYIFE
jgi:TonB family protein